MLHTKIVDSKKEKDTSLQMLKNLLKTLSLEHQFIF